MKKRIIIGSLLMASSFTFSGNFSNTFKIYSGGQFINYQENAPSQESGSLPNFGIYGEHNFSQYSKVTGEFDYQSGSLTYTGGLQNSSGQIVGSVSNTGNHAFYNGVVTYQVNISPMFSIPYLTYAYMGVGESLWLRATSEDYSTGDYQENYRYMYLPVGMNMTFPINDKLTLIPQAEVDYIFNGTMTAFLSQKGYPYHDATVQMGNSYGYKLSIEGDYAINQRIMVFAKPYYQYIKLNESNWTQYMTGSPEYVLKEPSSGTNIWGIQAGIGVNF